MRFSRLRLNGFKSFVDPTELIISDGLTGVVGPNGCGKSNLLEALRWVMGENRASAMRGGGMEDVIFAGAATRPARNFAEVSLSIDNAERTAPSGFNDVDILEIVRRITRDAGSAFKANARDVRARDVQMLFADASTGSHSPALVQQGQISELINAKPKNRRRILEEAAGISGLYQRRHEAELKLKGAEANLARVEDVIEQLAAQLAQLARQARQAARYREIGTQLRQSEGMLLFRRWQEAEDHRLQAARKLQEDVATAARAEREAIEAHQQRSAADEALPPIREEEAIAQAVVQRLAVQRDTLAQREAQATQAIQSAEARISQLGHDLDREDSLNRDAGQNIERLEVEAEDLSKAFEGHDARLGDAAAEARAAAELLQEREAALAELTEDVARLAARHQSAARLKEDAQKTMERGELEAERARASAEKARAELAEANAAATAAASEQADAQERADAAEKALADADTERTELQAREADARATRAEAEGEASALRAQVHSLARLVARDTAEDGQVMDLLTVAPGYERAIGAALADDLRAPVIDARDRSGWAVLPTYPVPNELPRGVAGLASYVSVPEVLARRISQVGLVDEADGPHLQKDLLPGQRLVSLTGDLWRWDGFRAAAEDAPSAATLRLQQLNRLVELKRDLEEAQARADGAVRAHEHLKNGLSHATEADQAARNARRAADARLVEVSRALSRAESSRSLAASKLEGMELAAERHSEAALEARGHLQEAEAALSSLADLGQARAEIEDVKTTVEAARITMISRRSAHDELRREGEARTKRSQEITQELSGWRQRLVTAEKRRTELADRKAAAEEELTEASGLPARIAEEAERLAEEIDKAEIRRRASADTLAQADEALRVATEVERASERSASAAREARAAAEARCEAADAGVQVAAERIREEQDTVPEKLLEDLAVDPAAMPDASELETDVTRLRRQRDSLGAVNLRAEADAVEVQTEHDSLASEKADLEGAISKLRSGIASLNREGRERLLTAFEQVNSNFGMLFTHLFGGGEAKLVMVESDDPLEAGLEIMCQPPGKRLSTLSLLSGGEQTLTALALIFGVFLANPAPICVLDEVDAPLDDANVTRFCDLLDEITRRTDTRFLIITHHAVTMSRMDRLFGVTMGEQGVSQLVSVDLKKAEALVA
ncbi:MAG: chromosome segregation protein SMC [Pseudomonadota bacterium]